MPSLPTQGGNTNTWGTDLNAWLLVGHNSDGTTKEVSIPYSVVKRNATHQSIPNSTVTAISFDQIKAGQTWWASSPNPTRLTVPTAGLYMIGATIEFDLNANGNRGGNIRKNGTTELVELIGLGFALTSVNNTCVGHSGFPVVMAANDYIELMAFQNSGVALNAVSDTSAPQLWAVRIGA